MHGTGTLEGVFRFIRRVTGGRVVNAFGGFAAVKPALHKEVSGGNGNHYADSHRNLALHKVGDDIGVDEVGGTHGV